MIDTLKGGMGVEELLSGEVCPEVSGLRGGWMAQGV
jgi:hypothetical protein